MRGALNATARRGSSRRSSSPAAGRITADHFYPAYLNFWQNGLLLSLSIAPVIVVWVAVVKNHFFDVDFVVSRALVYSTITAAVIFIVGSSEEILTYVFYNNTNLAYGIIIGISLVIGSTFGRVRTALEHFVDRFIFRERNAQRVSLERAAAGLLDAEDAETVYSVLLHDVPSILDLAFSGIMLRTPEGGYSLGQQWNWPAECVQRVEPGSRAHHRHQQVARRLARQRRALDDGQGALPERAA